MDVTDAIFRRDLAALEKLDSAVVNTRDGDGFTPLMVAVLEDGTDPSVVKVLIERGADVNAVEPGQRWTALHFAAQGQKEAIVRACSTRTRSWIPSTSSATRPSGADDVPLHAGLRRPAGVLERGAIPVG